jgi:hypothetical protein
MDVADRRSLETLISRCESLGFGTVEPITISIPDLQPDRRRELEAEVNDLWQECGCTLGAVSSLVSLVLLVTLVRHLPSTNVWGVGAAAAAGLATFLLAGGLGKLLGVQLAHRRLARRLRTLAPLVSTSYETAFPETIGQ